ncbi:hypothetical protein [uncultured Megamonas sp.]|uniref:hypothetical protein n=1 Tax=uncultured Megamonas sp. TaxID=286140 RepID=UPI002599C895|nr:hypothetical protein [uncultured Megamonas sp.]
MDENTKKDLARKLKNAFSIAETRAKRIQEIKEAKAKVNLMKKDNSNKPNYKKYKFKNELKTKTHRIIKGMKIRFRNGEWVSYKLGKIDTVVGRADGALTFDRFKNSVFKSFKDRMYTPDEDKDIEWDYVEEEKCSSVGGAGFHERK